MDKNEKQILESKYPIIKYKKEFKSMIKHYCKNSSKIPDRELIATIEDCLVSFYVDMYDSIEKNKNKSNERNN